MAHPKAPLAKHIVRPALMPKRLITRYVTWAVCVRRESAPTFSACVDDYRYPFVGSFRRLLRIFLTHSATFHNVDKSFIDSLSGETRTIEWKSFPVAPLHPRVRKRGWIRIIHQLWLLASKMSAEAVQRIGEAVKGRMVLNAHLPRGSYFATLVVTSSVFVWLAGISPKRSARFLTTVTAVWFCDWCGLSA